MVAVTRGYNIMELITRARTMLYIIIVDDFNNDRYAKNKEYFYQAEEKDLV